MSKASSKIAKNGSPKKQSKDFIVLDKDLMRGLTEKEVEIEHLKTTIIALSQKVHTTIDLT
jgi:hypothetical protein